MKSKDNKDIKDIIFPDDVWEKFKKASPHFLSARKEYIRNVPVWLTEQTVNIYEQMTGKKVLNKDFSCAHCVLRVYQLAGKLYFQELDRRNKLEEENKDGEKGNEKSKPRNSNAKKGNSRKSKRGNEQEQNMGMDNENL